ncbi:class II aldolase/adducin family protein [Ralstonia pseudosolanacearum]
MTEMQTELRMAARALARHGLAHAYGHVSRRLDADTFLVCAARPMALIGPEDAGTVVPVKGALPEGVLGEVRIHQQIYARRPDVQAVARTMPPALMALGTARRTPRVRHGFGGLLRPRRSLVGRPTAAARRCRRARPGRNHG